MLLLSLWSQSQPLSGAVNGCDPYNSIRALSAISTQSKSSLLQTHFNSFISLRALSVKGGAVSSYGCHTNTPGVHLV